MNIAPSSELCTHMHANLSSFTELTLTRLRCCSLGRYGDDASQATDTAIKSAVNVGVTAYNIDNLGIKAILKTAGKQTAKAMVKSPEGEGEEAPQQEQKEKTDGKEDQTRAEETQK